MKPKQFFYVILGLLGLVVVLGGAGYWFGLQYLDQRSEHLATKLAEQKLEEDQIETLARLQYRYNHEITPILNLIDSALPRDKKQTEILAQIQRVAGNVGLFVEGITMPTPQGLPSGVSQTIKAGQVSALPLNFEVKGTYDQLQAFTAQLEGLNRFTNITTLAVKHEQKTDPITYIINLNAYIKP